MSACPPRELLCTRTVNKTPFRGTVHRRRWNERMHTGQGEPGAYPQSAAACSRGRRCSRATTQRASAFNFKHSRGAQGAHGNYPFWDRCASCARLRNPSSVEISSAARCSARPPLPRLAVAQWGFVAHLRSTHGSDRAHRLARSQTLPASHHMLLPCARPNDAQVMIGRASEWGVDFELMDDERI